jgi:hypothetical protein
MLEYHVTKDVFRSDLFHLITILEGFKLLIINNNN